MHVSPENNLGCCSLRTGHLFIIIVVGGGSVLLTLGSQLGPAYNSWRRAWWYATAAPPVGSGDSMASSGFGGHSGTSTSSGHLRSMVATQPSSQSSTALVKACLRLFYVSGCFACVSVYRLSAWCPHSPGEGVRSPAQGLQVVVNHLVGARNQTRVLWRSQCS